MVREEEDQAAACFSDSWMIFSKENGTKGNPLALKNLFWNSTLQLLGCLPMQTKSVQEGLKSIHTNQHSKCHIGEQDIAYPDSDECRCSKVSMEEI